MLQPTVEHALVVLVALLGSVCFTRHLVSDSVTWFLVCIVIQHEITQCCKCTELKR